MHCQVSRSPEERLEGTRTNTLEHCQVEYQEEGIPDGQKKPTDYHQFGENGYYELVEFEETDAGPGAVSQTAKMPRRIDR